MDFAGPLQYKETSRITQVESAYDVLFTCASTRAVHLNLTKDTTAPTFQMALKEFIARRAKPSMIISDNAKTFQATKRWLDVIQNDQDIHNYLAQQNIKRRFNLFQFDCLWFVSGATWSVLARRIGIRRRTNVFSFKMSPDMASVASDDFQALL